MYNRLRGGFIKRKARYAYIVWITVRKMSNDVEVSNGLSALI